MSVPFEQAIEELYSIFSGFDKEIIETVLRQNKGHMEKTIDALLEMNGEQPINENTDEDQNIAQITQDEMLARIMQNQLFLNELKNDDDFSHLFNSNNQRKTNGERILTPKEEMEQFQREKALKQQRQQQQQYYDEEYYEGEQEPSTLSLFEEDFQDIKEKINQLGEVAKTKFFELTQMFNNKKEETKYEPIETRGDDNGYMSNNSSNYKNKSKDSDDEDEDSEDEEVVVYDRFNKNSIGVRNNGSSHTGVNSNYSLNNSDGGEEEYDSFILESDRNRTGSRLRTTAINSYSDKKKDL